MSTKIYYIPRHEISDRQCRSAILVGPEKIAELIRGARRPVLVVGGKLLEDERLVEYAAEFWRRGITLIATGASSKPLIERGVRPKFYSRTLHYVVAYMLDESWNGFDGRGRYDLALFMGFKPSYLSRMLSALKHFSDIVTVSIDEHYQPNATYSLTDFALIIKEDNCIGCGNCVVVCPYNAIECQSVVRNGRRLVVNVEFCRDCEYVYCTESCPYGALEFVKGGEVYYRAIEDILRHL